jgi:hypothetical protein
LVVYAEIEFATPEFAALEFESANPSIVKSIKQRDLLNTWLRLYAREQSLPRIEEYKPERIEEELPDLVFFNVESIQPPRLIIESDGTRMSIAYGHSGKGKYLEEYLGARLVPMVMPVYSECLRRALPVYTISNVDDSYGRIVAYERLLLPFSDRGKITHIIASLKTISEDGNFEIRNLMRDRLRPVSPRTRPHCRWRRDRIQRPAFRQHRRVDLAEPIQVSLITSWSAGHLRAQLP